MTTLASDEELYQPHRKVIIDERMVRSKARFSFRQYIRNKPTKWGFKLWCMCDDTRVPFQFTMENMVKFEVKMVWVMM